jgi:leucyl-tRNA synthetase
VPTGADPKTIEAAALADEKVRARTAGKNVVKVIVVPGRTVNLVVK